MKNILFSSFDMEVGGVERSLISLLENFDYEKYEVDLMLYKQQGDFMPFLTKNVNLLNEIPQYATFRKSIKETIKGRYFGIALSRLFSKIHADINGKKRGIEEPGYYQMQLMWLYSLPFLPSLEKEYDVAISYLWPHYFIAEKVKAKKKIAWIHTDYSTVEPDIQIDLNMWGKFDHIIAVSEACKKSFLEKYSDLEDKVVVIENITSPEFIKKMSTEELENPLTNDNRFKILTVARLSHAKGIDKAVKALNQLKKKGYKKIVWYVVGYGGEEEKIRSLIREYKLEDSFILLGKQVNPYPFIKYCDLYVQPSRYEGKAVTVTEAKILGKPILITNYPTASSQVVNGIDGLICELDESGIYEGIELLFNDVYFRKSLSDSVTQNNYENKEIINDLYSLIN